jgi:hypothetical protein
MDWLSRNLGIDDIVGIRARTIRGNSALRAVAGSLQEIALSARPLDAEVAFERPVTFSLSFDGTVAPVGMTGAVKALDVIGNARVERAVDRVISDTDLAATDACVTLMESDIDVYRISGLMTAGLLGRRKKFVPTRWAITAVDDTISVRLKKEIARFPPVERIFLFSAELFANRIVCILAPGDWKFEMVEIWNSHSLWAGEEPVIVSDREGMTKRGYSPISGAYYSARLAVCEHLKKIRRSARVVVIRSIGSGYWAPLGTWVIREAARKAMSTSPVACQSPDMAVVQASAILGFDFWVPHSSLIQELRTQRTLF